MPKVVHFELPFDDAARANQFYAGVFGWESSKFEGGPEEYYLQQTGGDDEPYGIGGALIERAAALNRGGTLVVLGVDDLDAYIGKVTAGRVRNSHSPHSHTGRWVLCQLPGHRGQCGGHVPGR